MDVVDRHGEPDALEISPEALTGPVAQALVAALMGQLSALYPETWRDPLSARPG